jgi:serine/threonine-protein kinase
LLKPAPKPEPKPAPDPGPAPEATSPPPTPPITIPPLPRQVEEILDKQYDRSLEGLKQAGADLDFLTKFNLNPYDAAQRQKVEDRKTEFPGIILQIQKDLGLILSCKVSVKDKTTGLMRTEKKTFYILAADHPASSLMIPNGKTLGVGGMAEVYDGRDADGKAVAIKVTKPSAEGPEFGDLKPEERAETEAAAAGAITSKHVVRIFGLGETSSGRPFIVMEKFTEGNLRGIIVGKGMDEKVAAGYLEGLLSGLQAIHDAGIVHRDIKPENIFLVRDPRGGEYYGVHADFGMARRMTIRTGGTDAHTQYLSLLGTPSFIAPELKFLQYLDYVGIGVGTDVWERVAFQRQDDLYAMGVTAYEMLTNEKPRNTMSDQSFGEFCVQIPEKLQKAAELEVRRRILQKRGESLSPGESAQLTTLIGELRAWKAAGGVKDLLAQNAKRVESDPKFTPDLAKIHSPQLREAVAKLLAYDPGNRYQSASQAREAVDDFLKGRTPSPLRPSGAEPTIAAGAAGTGAMRVGSEDIRPVSGSSAAPATPGAAPSRPESWSRVPEGAVIAPPGVAPAPAPAAPPPPPIVFRLPAMSAAAPGAPAPGTSPFQRGATGSSAPPPSFAPAPAEPRRSAVPTAAPSRQFLTGTDEQIMADLDSILVEDVNLTEASLTHISALAFRKALPKEIREKAKGVLNYLTGGEE